MVQTDTNEYPHDDVVVLAATIASGTKSGAVKTYQVKPVGILVPAGVASSTMTFEMSVDGTTFVPVYSSVDSANYSINIAASKYVPLNVPNFSGVNELKIVCSDAETAKAYQIVCRSI